MARQAARLLWKVEVKLTTQQMEEDAWTKKSGSILNTQFVASMNYLKMMEEKVKVMDEKKRGRLCYHLHMAEAIMRDVEGQMMETDEGLLRDQGRTPEQSSEEQSSREEMQTEESSEEELPVTVEESRWSQYPLLHSGPTSPRMPHLDGSYNPFHTDFGTPPDPVFLSSLPIAENEMDSLPIAENEMDSLPRENNEIPVLQPNPNSNLIWHTDDAVVVPFPHLRIYGLDRDEGAQLRQILNQAESLTFSGNAPISVKKVYKDKKNNQRRLIYKVWGECCFQPAFVDTLRGILGHYNARVDILNRDQHERPEERNWVLGSLNVSSIRRESRRSEVVETAGERMTLINDYIMRHNVDFFALQETGRTIELPGWEIHDYYLLERAPSRLEKGIRGIGMLVKKNLQPNVLQKSTYNDLWVQVNTGCGLMHVVSVYLPNKNMAQKEAVHDQLTEKIRNHIAEFPSTPLILMGDFNMHPKQMEKWVSTLGREMVLAKQATPCNTYPKDNTTLDYVVYRHIPGFRCESVVVDTQNEISDHRIINTAVCIPVVKKPQTRFVLDREKIVSLVLDSDRLKCDSFPTLEKRDDPAAVLQFNNAIWDEMHAKQYFKQVGPALHSGTHYLLYYSERRILAYARVIEKERARNVPETPQEKAERDEVLRKRKAILRRVQQNRKLALGRRIAALLRDGKQNHLWNVIRDSMTTRVKEHMMLLDPVTQTTCNG